MGGVGRVLSDRIQQGMAVRRRYGLRAGLRALTSDLRPLGRAVRDELQNAETFFLFAMDEAPRLERSREASRTHRFLYATEAELLAACEKLPDYVAPNAGYLLTGDRCLLQMDGDEPVGCTWATGVRTAYLTQGVHWNLADHSFYSYLGETRPAWRGFGYQPLRKQMLLDAYREEGRSWLLGYVRAQAMPALRGTKRSGDTLVGEFRVQKTRGRVRVRLEVDRDFWSTNARW